MKKKHKYKKPIVSASEHYRSGVVEPTVTPVSEPAVVPAVSVIKPVEYNADAVRGRISVGTFGDLADAHNTLFQDRHGLAGIAAAYDRQGAPLKTDSSVVPEVIAPLIEENNERVRHDRAKRAFKEKAKLKVTPAIDWVAGVLYEILSFWEKW